MVLTHFPPHPACIAPPYADSPLNPYFINQIDVAGFDYWIAGHTHHVVDTVQDSCRIISSTRWATPTNTDKTAIATAGCWNCPINPKAA